MEQDIHCWQRLEELFAEAVDLPRDRQAEFVDRETAADGELRRRLLALLQHDADAGVRIARAIGGAAQAAAAPIDWTGRRFGPYRVVREIGRGGMGLVFEAVRDDDEYRKTVAVKIAPWWCDLDLLRDRFRHERQILAGLEHPNIARFLDGGTQNGVPYFAMEYVEGRPITDHARGLRLREKIELFRVVCSAVHYAHQSLLVHRDLKPGNILVTGEGVPKLLDFGIAKLLSPFDDAGKNTLTGSAPWTPDYASPEQVRAGPITTRTDIYSLGLVLFELLTGERGQVADQSSPLALDRSICEAEIPRPSTRAVQSMRRQLVGDLDTIVGMATHKDPMRRYHSVAQFSEDLQRYLSGRPVVAREDSALYRASKFLRRHWLPAAAMGVAALSLVVGAVGFAWQARLAESRFDQVRKLATGFLFEVHDKVQNMPDSTEVREMVTRAAVESLATLSRDAGRNYSLRRELATAYLRLGTVQGAVAGGSKGRSIEALASFEHGLSLLRGIPPAQLSAAAETEAGLREQRGRILTSSNRSGEAEVDLMRALEIRRSFCRDPLQQKQACAERLNTLMAAMEWSVRARRMETTEGLLRELAQALEELRPVLSATGYRKQWLRLQLFSARVQWLHAGGRAGADSLLPALPAVEQLVASNPDDKEAVRLGVNFCEQLGSILLGADSPADATVLERVLRHGVEWTERLVRFDANDQHTQRQAAAALGMLGDFVVRQDLSRGRLMLRTSIARLLEQLRLSPSNYDILAQIVDHSDHLVQAEARGGKEQEAADDLHSVLEYYDPLQSLGLKLPRAEPVRQLQALAWVAQAGSGAGRPGAAWYRGAARRADRMLAESPSDPALKGAAALLYAALPGSPEECAHWRNQAADLWRMLAAQFPGNAALLGRTQEAAGSGLQTAQDHPRTR